MTEGEKRYSLSEFLEEVKDAIESSLPESRWVAAEISGIQNNWPGSHCYLELIESESGSAKSAAKARAIIWGRRNMVITPYFEKITGSPLAKGMKILVNVTANFSPVFGFSLIINEIDPSFTLGDFEARRREVFLRLKNEGLLEQNKELAVPLLPCRIAIVSSSSAAGYGDFMNHLKSDSSVNFKTELFEAPMQGNEAPNGVAAAFAAIAKRAEEFDVVVLIRGGGGQADLACFDDYTLAKAVADSVLPVISGVGHERDNHNCDEVAAVRVKTPTAAADYILDLFKEQRELISKLEEDVLEAVAEHIGREEDTLQRLSSRVAFSVQNKFLEQRNFIVNILHSIAYSIARHLSSKENELALLEARLHGADPMQILSKGYGIIYSKGRKILSVKEIENGSILRIMMKDGEAEFEVKNLKSNK